jgi:hypothetical protein
VKFGVGVWVCACACGASAPNTVLLRALPLLQHLRVFGGSGRISYTFNDSRIASHVVHPSTTTVDVFPLAPGPVAVVAHDDLLPSTAPAEALVLVTLIARIEVAVRSQVCAQW